MQEVVCIHVGQAGIQMSNAAWELFCIEHGIEANGLLKDSLKDDDSTAFKTFFFEAPNSQFVPRCLTVDLESSVIDEVRTGSYRNLFNPDQLLNVFDDGSNNFARAHFTVGKSFIDLPMNALRKITENCDSLQGFFLFHSHGGGTGSGFTSLILSSLSSEYAKTLKFQFSIFPSPVLCSAVVEPYNATLSAQYDVGHSDISTLISNEAVFNICNNLLVVPRPTYSNINRVISHGFSDLTVSLRFESTLTANFAQMGVNLIPYPRIHFPLMTHAPLMSNSRAEHEQLSTNQITKSAFEPGNQLITCDMKNGLYMCCVLQYRGNVSPKDVNVAVFELKRKREIKFVDWCPTGFKLGINSQPKVTVPSSEMAQSSRSVTMISNATGIKDPIQSVMNKFDILLHKRSFVHWFVGEGMEEGEFNEARDEIANLILDFMEIGTSNDDEENEASKDENVSDIKIFESVVIKEIDNSVDKDLSEEPVIKENDNESTKEDKSDEELEDGSAELVESENEDD